VSLPERCVPLPHITHEGEAYRLTLEVLPDPRRDVVLISFHLSGERARLYTLLAPHLGNGGEHNNARAAADLTAWREASALCLVSDGGFSRSSAGFVGFSDGWQDFSRNGSMTWQYEEALDGNVALTAELQGNEGTLALGFAETIVGARTKARASLSEGYQAIRRRFLEQWQDWGNTLAIPDVPDDVWREAYLSATVLKVQQDRAYPGSIVASLSVPWGNSSDSLAGIISFGRGIVSRPASRSCRSDRSTMRARCCPT
jgi:glucoamylase